MDILYVVGIGSKWYNNELRYSLRSIEKYGKNVGRIYLVGTMPEWVNPEYVTYIPCNDPYKRAHKNIMLKITNAIERSDISRHFLISSDDHFYVKEVDFDTLPIYHKRERIEGGKDSSYTRSMLQTRRFLAAHGLPTYATNPHCNTHFDVDMYEKHKDLFEKGLETEWGVEANCLMGNLLIQAGAEHKAYEDKKIGTFRSIIELEKKIGDTECFSIYDSAIDSGVGCYLDTLFPVRSKYEL